MTDAPKIDTQAPDASSKMPPRIWATYYADYPGTAGLWDHIKRYEWEDRVEYERRDLADARAAAAWQGGIDALLDRVGDLPISEIAADEVIYAAKQLTPPTDTTALDRLIAERVREARTEAFNEAASIARAEVERQEAAMEKAVMCVSILRLSAEADAAERIAIAIVEADRGSKEGQS